MKYCPEGFLETVSRQVSKTSARFSKVRKRNNKIQKQARADNKASLEDSKTEKRFPGQVNKQDVQ